MIKKIAVVLLIFAVLTIAPQGQDLYDWIKVNSAGIIESVSNAVASIGNTISSLGSAAPAMASATQPAAETPAQTPAPTQTPTATPEPTPTPTPSPTPTPTPQANLFGKVDGQTYVNEAIGFRFNIPEGYSVYDEQSIIQSVSKDPEYKDAANDPEKMNELVQSGRVPVFYATKHPSGYSGGFNAILDASAEQMASPFPGSLQELADLIKESLAKSQENTTFQNTQMVTINGAKAALISGTVKTGSVKYTQKMYLIENSSWLITLTFAGTSKTELDEMTKAVQSVELTDPSVSLAPAAESKDRGTIGSQTYTNNTGGFTLNYPAGYTATNDPETIKTIALASFDAIKGLYKNADALRQLLETQGSSDIFIAYKHTKAGVNNQLSVSMSKTKGFSGTVMDYAALMKNTFLLVSDKITFDNPASVRIGGVDGAVIKGSYKVGENTIYENIYMFMKNGYMVEVDLTAADETGMQELGQVMDTIRILTGV